jgi:hypothetical protein
MRITIILLCLICLVGCSNKYESATRKSLEGWPYWQENYYIQKITTYEILSPYYIQGIPYVKVWVNVVNKYTPYREKSFTFFVRKDYPNSMGIPNNQEWRNWNGIVKNELRLLLEENEQN